MSLKLSHWSNLHSTLWIVGISGDMVGFVCWLPSVVDHDNQESQQAASSIEQPENGCV